MTGSGKIVKGFFGDADNMVFDEWGAFAGAVFRMFEATFPFEYSPAFIIILRPVC